MSTWPGEYADPRFIKVGSILDTNATEGSRHPEWGPGDPVKLPKAPAVSFCPVPYGSAKFNRFGGLVGETTEVQRLPEIGPEHYDKDKFDLFPRGGVRAQLGGVSSSGVPLSTVPRFHPSSEERTMAETRADMALNMSYLVSDKEFWSASIPHISKQERFLSGPLKVPDPSRDFQRKGQGFHVSQGYHPGDRRRRKPHLVSVDKLRSASVPLSQEVPPPMFGDNEPDEFKGMGPYLGYQSSLQYRARFAPNVVKSSLASVVPRSPRTVIGGPAVCDSSLGPGQGFDESDQYWSNVSWGRWATWNRWQIQHEGEFRARCPIVEADKAAKRSKRLTKKKPELETIQAKQHGAYRNAVKNKESWAVEPSTRKSWEEYEAEYKARETKTNRQSSAQITTDHKITTVAL